MKNIILIITLIIFIFSNAYANKTLILKCGWEKEYDDTQYFIFDIDENDELLEHILQREVRVSKGLNLVSKKIVLIENKNDELLIFMNEENGNRYRINLMSKWFSYKKDGDIRTNGKCNYVDKLFNFLRLN